MSMPARKKDPSVRARRNKSATRATLSRVADSTTTADAYADMTVAQLRTAIDLRNESRPADQKLSKRGTKATLVEVLVAADSPVPPLPTHPPRWTSDGEQVAVEWHAQTRAWWNDVWTSPMAAEWDESDVHNVLVVALLYDDIWAASDAKSRKEALGEYRLQRADLGLSPYSRRRLEWTIETADEAKDRGTQRRERRRTSPAPEAPGRAVAEDPRNILRSVK